MPDWKWNIQSHVKRWRTSETLKIVKNLFVTSSLKFWLGHQLDWILRTSGVVSRLDTTTGWSMTNRHFLQHWWSWKTSIFVKDRKNWKFCPFSQYVVRSKVQCYWLKLSWWGYTSKSLSQTNIKCHDAICCSCWQQCQEGGNYTLM